MVKKKVEVFHSLEEENQAEYHRRARRSPRERMQELASLQERVWGKGWHEKPMEKVATWELLDW